MKWIVLAGILVMPAYSQVCVDNAKVVAPVLSEAARKTHAENLDTALANYKAKPGANSVIWLARRQGYLGQYKEAIATLSTNLQRFSYDARMYRHRGHRYITLRCFDDAIRDLEKGVSLIKGKPDEIEPDGLPNAKNIPTSTLHSNIWYHLGLAYYLKGDFKNALRAYKEGQKVSKNNDMRVATTHWLYMSLRRLGRNREAERLLTEFDDNFEVIENNDYLKLIKLYQGKIKQDDFIKNFGHQADSLSNSTLGYGWGNWHLYNKEPEDAKRIFGFVTAGNQWASFGYIAAEQELARYGITSQK